MENKKRIWFKSYYVVWKHMWFNDQKTEHIIVNDINTKDTVTRQFKTVDLFVKEGTSIKFKLAN